MFREMDHELLFITRPTHTTDWGVCTCGGLDVWMRTKEEIRAVHEQHLIRERAKITQAVPAASPVEVSSGHGLHELKWTSGAGRLVGYCSGCNWRVDTRPRWKIKQAYQVHLASLPKTF